MLQTMNSNARLIDVGGNIGQYTLAAAAMGYDVDIFEPVPQNVVFIQKSLHRNNFKSVVVHPFALYNRNTLLNMGINSINQRMVKHNPVSASKTTTVLSAFSLDSIYGHPSQPIYLKIDVEGSECEAFDGMKSYLSQAPDIVGVNMEFSHAKTLAELNQQLRASFKIGSDNTL